MEYIQWHNRKGIYIYERKRVYGDRLHNKRRRGGGQAKKDEGRRQDGFRPPSSGEV